MTVREINRAIREDTKLYARGQFRAFRVYGARMRRGRRELRLAFGVIDGRAHCGWVPVRGFGMVVPARDGSII